MTPPPPPPPPETLYQAVPRNAWSAFLGLEPTAFARFEVDDENLKEPRDVGEGKKFRVKENPGPRADFPWLDMPPVAFSQLGETHTIYGDFADLGCRRFDRRAGFL